MIEFQYFEECPNATSTLENLRALVGESVIEESDLKLTLVPTPEYAEELNFQGSPTVLVDGFDIYTGRAPVGHSFNCRIYQIEGTATGILPKEFIKNRLLKIRSSQNR